LRDGAEEKKKRKETKRNDAMKQSRFTAIGNYSNLASRHVTLSVPAYPPQFLFIPLTMVTWSLTDLTLSPSNERPEPIEEFRLFQLQIGVRTSAQLRVSVLIRHFVDSILRVQMGS
jgi:hypothetical protein